MGEPREGSRLQQIIQDLDQKMVSGAVKFLPHQLASIQEWVDEEYQRLEDAVRNDGLSRGSGSGTERARLTVRHTLGIHVEEAEDPSGRLKLQVFKRRCIAEGWNSAEMPEDAPHNGIEVSIRAEPITVMCGDGTAFTPELPDHKEDTSTAARRITSKGAWRYLKDGRREFIPAHSIRSVRLGSAASG